jgi:hypothetical protein
MKVKNAQIRPIIMSTSVEFQFLIEKTQRRLETIGKNDGFVVSHSARVKLRQNQTRDLYCLKAEPSGESVCPTGGQSTRTP